MANLNRTQTILRNIVCNWLGYVVQAAVVFFLTPYVLHQLGDARYGVWALITSVTGTYGLLAFGLQGGVNQYLTRYFASRDYQKMNEVASTATAVLSLVGVAILLLSLIVAALFPYLFDVPADLTREVRLCTVIVGTSVAVQMALFVFSSVFMATQRYDLSNAIGVFTRLLSAGLIVVGLKLDYGLVGISVATLLANCVDYLFRWRIALRLVPELTVAKSFISKTIFREIFSFGAWSFVGTLAQSLNASAPQIIIGAFLPISAMAPYALAMGLVRQLEGIFHPVVMVFFPAITELHARDELHTMRTVYLTGSRLFLLGVAVVAAISGVFAEDFFRLWVGNEYVNGKNHTSVAFLYQILLVGMVCRLLPGIGSQVLLGTLRVKQLTLTYLMDAIGTVVFSVVAINQFGLTGVAFSSALSAICFRSVVIPFIVSNVLEVRMLLYAIRVWARPVLVATVLVALALLLRNYHDPHSFGELILMGIVIAVVALPLVVIGGMDQDDRSRIFRYTRLIPVNRIK